MSLLYDPRPFTGESKRQAIATLLDNIVPDRDFYLLLVGAVLLATGGIFLDSVPVLIASMIVAPLAYPILGLGLGLASRDWRLIRQSSAILIAAFMIILGLTILVTMVFGHVRIDNIFISFTPNRFLAAGIAIIAGCIAAYGLVRPKVSEAMTGIAIAVSLMPPLVATGIELASRKNALAKDAMILFLLNVAGILAASIFVFTLLGITREYHSLRD
jgi:uncharacterized hydrophobic protein (TIGR00271 family)